MSEDEVPTVEWVEDPVEHEFMRAMPTSERRQKLEACFTWLRTNFVGLTEYQEYQLKKYMEVR